MRVVRVLLGVVAILVALPLLLGGAALWAVMQHRADDGSFTAALAPMRPAGYAVVVPDVDALLRREAPFVRGGQTTMRFTARTGGGPAFIGLAPRAAVERYLHGVPHAAVSQVRLARGGLPVTLSSVSGPAALPSPPADQTFWLVSSASGTLFWSPSDRRGEQLSLVVMSPAGQPTGEVLASAAMLPRWLDPTTYGLLILGTVAFLIGIVLLFWPRGQREIVYVVEPGQVPEIAARLGISTEPLAAALSGSPDPLDLPDPDPGSDPGEPAVVSAPAGVAVTPLSAGEAVVLGLACQAEAEVEPPAWLVDPDRVDLPPAPVSPAPAMPVARLAHVTGVTGVTGVARSGEDRDFQADPAVSLGNLPGNADLSRATPAIDLAPAVGGASEVGMPMWAGPTPLPVATGQPGAYRSLTAPPPITPSFVWPPAPEVR